MMEQYVVYLGLQDVLKMKFSSWQSIVKMMEESEKKQNSALFGRLGIEYTETAQVATIKSEDEHKEAAHQKMSEEEVKTLKKIVKSVREVYSILYQSIPQELRLQIGSEHEGNGAYLWQWLDTRLQPTGVAALHDNIAAIFSMQQSNDESFEQYKARVDVVNDRLAKSGIDLQPEIYRYVVLERLRQEYQPIVLNLRLNSEYKSNGKDNVTMWSKIVLQMIQYERTQKELSGDSSSGTAMAARGKASQHGQLKRDYSSYKCHQCGEIGHIKYKCPTLTNNQAQAKSAIAAPEQSSSAAAASHEMVSSAFGFAAIGYRVKPTYSAVVSAGIATARKSTTQATTVMSPAVSSSAPLKRLIRPDGTGAPSQAVIPKSSSTTPVRTRPQDHPAPSAQSVSQNSVREKLQNAKVPGPTSSKAGRPMEKRLKQMTWGLDSMASVHCTGNKELLSNRRLCSPMRILCANDDLVEATSCGL